MPHDDPFRLRVKKAICAALKTITPANGYKSDLSDFEAEDGVTVSRVYRGRDEFGFNDPRPMVSVLEHPRALDPLLTTDGAPASVGQWELLIQGFVQDDPLNPTDPADTLAADVIVCLVEQGRRKLPASNMPDNILGMGNVMPCIKPGNGLRVGKPVVRPPDGEISDVAMFYLTLTLDLVEDTTKPFD